MARHPRIEACMFCSDFPCSCPKPEKKPTARKKAVPKPVSDKPIVDDEVLVAPPIDVAAAMKAAATGTSQDRQQMDRELHEAKPRWVSRDEVDELHRRKSELEAEMAAVPDDPDLIAALNVLEPILHPDERERYGTVLSTPSSRAARWKARNASQS